MKLLALLTISLILFRFAEAQTEFLQFQRNNVKIFSGKGLAKSRGLNFSLKYPATYSAEQHSNENIVMQFVDNKSFNSIYNIGVIKGSSNILDNNVLSRSNLESSVRQITNDAVILNYTNRLTINHNNAAYIDYISFVTPEQKAVIRQYFIVHKSYLVVMSFSVPVFLNGTLERTKTKFQDLKPFFEKAVQSLKIQN